MKKLVASLLAVATVASMASMTAFADRKFIAEVGNGYIFDDDKTEIKVNEIQPDETFYIDLSLLANENTDLPAGKLLVNEDMFKVKVKKGDDDSKMIKKISVTEKNIDKDDGRENVIKIELKDDMTDKDYKINPSVTFTAKYDMMDNGDKAGDADTATIKNGEKFEVKLSNFFVSNKEQKGDYDWESGKGGFVAKPTKNDDNEITWEDKNDTIAKLTFEGDDDVNKYYPKLSTKWDESDYAENFANTDAYIRNFVGNPTISATARPVLELNNPFVNDDDELTVAHEDTVIYQVVDGALVDVTDKFTMGENEDGDEVFTIKTRTLGTYIISNGAAVASEEEVPEEVEAPEEEQKANPGTGRF